jgi:CxxC motif-containing protein (DUF1111 family)
MVRQSRAGGFCPRVWLPGLAVVLMALSACGGVDVDVRRPPGDPLPGLTEAELARFQSGRELFDRQWTPEQGLGPLYMQPGCGSCHDLPTIGGAGVEPLREATHWDPDGGCDILTEEGGPLIQSYATPLLQATGFSREFTPPSANGFLVMEAPALFGLGLLEAIPDETILAREDPDDTNGDGISGRASWLPDGRLGRLGHKAYRATILELSEGAFRRSLGLTTPSYLEEETMNGVPIPPEVDPVPDPEVSQEELETVADFIRFLAPAEAPGPESRAVRDTLERGEDVFYQLGCPTCHVPSMTTGPSEIEALDQKRVFLYSDLLLHDLAPERPTICGPTATPSEVRTARLMGLRFRSRLMHDNRATSVDQALRMHGGEAAAAREMFGMLGPEMRGYLVYFLMSL